MLKYKIRNIYIGYKHLKHINLAKIDLYNLYKLALNI
jgi:hypothetical protein